MSSSTPHDGAWRTFRRGISLSPQLRVGLPVTAVLALLATAGRAIVPIAVQRTIDDGFGGDTVDLDAVVGIVAGAGVAVLVTAVASAAMHYRLSAAVESALSSLRIRAFRHIHDLSVLHQAAEQRGGLVARVTSDVDEISRFMQWAGLNLLTAVGQLTVATVVMAVYSWQLTLVVLLLFSTFAWGVRWFQRRLATAFLTVRERVGRMLGVIAEVVVGVPVIRAHGIEPEMQRRVDTAVEEHRAAAVRAGGLTSWFSGTGELFAAVATSAVLVVGVRLGVAGAVSPGELLAFLFLITLFVEPVVLASEVINEGQAAIAGWRRVLDVLDREPDVVDPGDDGIALPRGIIGLRAVGVSFRYPGADLEALSGLDVEIEPGARVAVVGETGSGKSTFAKLMTRLMDPVEGEILIGGVPLTRVASSSLRRRVVIVPQDGALLDGTIADNVRMGRAGADDEEITEVFASLHLAQWLRELPAGLSTRTGERGTALSVGERQLVALARAAIADPDVLVLDEATSAVDPATEQRLQRAMDGLAHHRTTIAIAHRLSTARAADEVLVFDQGRLVQHGRHEELLEVPGVYADLYASWLTGISR